MNLGIPDCILAKDGRFALAELKIAEPSGKVRVSAHQVSFHMGHGAYPCFLVVKLNDGKATKVLVYRGFQAMELAEKGTKLEPALSATINDWESIENFIFQG